MKKSTPKPPANASKFILNTATGIKVTKKPRKGK